MRPNRTTCEPGNTTTKDHSPPPSLLHRWHAELREEVGGTGVGSPCLFEIFDAHFVDGLDAGFSGVGAGVIEEDGWVTHALNDLFVQTADFVVAREVGLECPCFDALDRGLKLFD